MRKILRKYHLYFLPTSVVFAGLIVISCFCAASGQGRANISVSPETIVDGYNVQLGRISRISGGGESAERLKNISLGYAPNVGATREISRDQIVLSIKAAGFADAEFSLETPSRMIVKRSGQPVPQDQIRAAVEKAISDRFASDKVSMKIVRLDLPPKTEVIAGKVEVRARTAGVRNMFERFSVPVELRVDGKLMNSFAANVEIEAFADVLVAGRDMAANTTLGAADVRLENRRLVKPITDYIRTTDRLRGMRLVKNIASGDPLTSDSYVATIVIQSGDPVRVEGRSGNVKVIVMGEARTSGKIGDRIAVKNTQSGAILQAVVVDAGLVKVIL